MNVELEHGTVGGDVTNVTNDHPGMTARIALAHLRELPDYYERLERMERDVRASEPSRVRKRGRRGRAREDQTPVDAGIFYVNVMLAHNLLDLKKPLSERLLSWADDYEIGYKQIKIEPLPDISGYLKTTADRLIWSADEKLYSEIRLGEMGHARHIWNSNGYQFPIEMIAIYATWQRIKHSDPLGLLVSDERILTSRFLYFTSMTIQVLSQYIQFESDIPLEIQELLLRSLVADDPAWTSYDKYIRDLESRRADWGDINAYEQLSLALWEQDPGEVYLASKRLLMPEVNPYSYDDLKGTDWRELHPALVQIEQSFYKAMFGKVPEGFRALELK